MQRTYKMLGVDVLTV